jgi:D-glycero-D-manno-heptose 1,7-bisphosphate phosphatase
VDLAPGSDRVAVFLDRDGTLNVKPPEGEYVRSVNEFEWLPGAAEGAAALSQAGLALFVVSNQRGVARGLVDEVTLTAIEGRIQSALHPLGAQIEAFTYCRHDLSDHCDCRKPRPGMIMRLVRERGLRLADSWMVGDAVSDVAAGQAAGCRTALLADPRRAVDVDPAPDLVMPSLQLASQRIITEVERAGGVQGGNR